MALTDGILGYWPLGESQDGMTGYFDFVRGNTLTSVNTPANSASGKIGECADFERGSTEYAQILHASQTGLDVTGDISISVWYSVESAFAANYVICSKASNSLAQGYTLISFSDGSVQFDIQDGTNNTYGRTAASLIPTTGTLKHVVATFDADGAGDKVKVYVDGTLQANNTSANAASSINTGTNPFSIAARSDSNLVVGNHHDGKIDELGVWERVLTAAEVTALYNGGSGLQYPFRTVLDTGFVAPTQIDDTGSHTAWTNKNNMMASDNSYATATANNTRNYARNFGWQDRIPAGSIVVGFEYSVEAFESANNGTTVRVRNSPDSGTTPYGEQVAALGESDTGAQTIGLPTELMDKMWPLSELSDTNFRLHVLSANGGTHGTVSLDQIRMKVYYVPPERRINLLGIGYA